MDEILKKEDEVKQEVLPEAEVAQAEEGEASSETAGEEVKEERGRNSILWFLGGLYLMYTAYKLIQGYVTGAEESSLLFMVIGIFFGVTGAILAYLGFQEMGKKKGKSTGEGLIGAAVAKLQEEPKEEKRRLSISERASLANGLKDAEEGEEEENG